jgi:hypothetical protein
MTLSTNSFIRSVTFFSVLLLALVSHAANGKSLADGHIGKAALIAVLPVYNLSAAAAPLQHIRQSLIDLLRKGGVRILDDRELHQSMKKQRLRYVGGINQNTSSYFKRDTAADAILVTTLEHYDETFAPKIALLSRLVATGQKPEILWTTGVGLSGDESPGLLELNLIRDPLELIDKAVERLASELSDYLTGTLDQEAGETLRPDVSFVSPGFDTKRRYKIAIIPFFNNSSRKYAGEIIGLHFANGFRKQRHFIVIEPGVVRQKMLRSRIVMDDGISLADAGGLFSLLGVDLILTGNILDYQDYQGRDGSPVVNFSAEMIEQSTRNIVWLSRSVQRGDDGVYLFDWGKVNTANSLADAMVRGALESIVP